MSIISKPWKLYNKVKTALTGGAQKTYGTGAITSVNPNVGKPSKSALNKQIQLTKASGAKLKQTLFESQNKAFKGDDFTFATNKKKTLSNTEKQKLKEGLYGGGSKVTKKATGGRVGLKRGTGLTRKSNIQKIKETFGPKQKPQSRMTGKKKKFPDMSGDGKVTKKDILIARGVIPKPKKRII